MDKIRQIITLSPKSKRVCECVHATPCMQVSLVEIVMAMM